MIEVIKKVEQYRIVCKKCHSLLKYDDEYDELGRNEFEEKIKQEQEERSGKSYLWMAKLIDQDFYIWCPVCGNKVITASIDNYTHQKIHMGQRI